MILEVLNILLALSTIVLSILFLTKSKKSIWRNVKYWRIVVSILVIGLIIYQTVSGQSVKEIYNLITAVLLANGLGATLAGYTQVLSEKFENGKLEHKLDNAINGR